ncbi:unnamed protein product [Cylicostephanus goldi]|uniref:Uncharacterized protein n=1 Tax=Cylicostephanus goldi TaxID=71465 RepID=A0A3P6R4F4_CYLGO|nr:unnamed protein product [Cylicostephanus goldi]
MIQLPSKLRSFLIAVCVFLIDISLIVISLTALLQRAKRAINPFLDSMGKRALNPFMDSIGKRAYQPYLRFEKRYFDSLAGQSLGKRSTYDA